MRSASIPQRAPSATQISAIVDAMSRADLKKHAAWNDLSKLSSHTSVDGIAVEPAGIIVAGDRFRGLAAIYVALKYDAEADGPLETSDTLEGQFEGHFEGTRPVIDKVTVDTSPFYD